MPVRKKEHTTPQCNAITSNLVLSEFHRDRQKSSSKKQACNVFS